MSENTYAIIGNAKMALGLELGISTYRFDPQTAAMVKIGTFAKDLHIGAQAFDPVRNMVYVVDEFWSQPGRTGGGGNIASFDFDPESGELSMKNIKRTFATNPSYITLDKTRNYVIVSHHCTDHFVTRIVKTENGFDSEILYDKCVMELFEILEDGSIGELLDIYEIEGHDSEGIHTFPHLHCVIPNHDRSYFMVCDKGLDKIYTFSIDYEKRKLVLNATAEAEPHTDPRYGCFHPEKPVFYSNCEAGSDINTFKMDPATGKLTLLNRTPCIKWLEAGHFEPSDIVVHPNGKYLYVSIRTVDRISVMEILEDDTLVLKETIPSEGVNPRGLCITPDGRFLLAANMQSASVNGFSIRADGTLNYIGILAKGGFPGNIEIISVPDSGR